MDPVTLIVTALAAGAASALQDNAKAAVKAAVARLRELARKRFKDPANGEYLLVKHAVAPEAWQAPLEAELVEAGAASDPDLIAAAQDLMRLLDAKGSQDGKYVVRAANTRGVQISDRRTQTNYF